MKSTVSQKGAREDSYGDMFERSTLCFRNLNIGANLEPVPLPGPEN